MLLHSPTFIFLTYRPHGMKSPFSYFLVKVNQYENTIISYTVVSSPLKNKMSVVLWKCCIAGRAPSVPGSCHNREHLHVQGSSVLSRSLQNKEAQNTFFYWAGTNTTINKPETSVWLLQSFGNVLTEV